MAAWQGTIQAKVPTLNPDRNKVGAGEGGKRELGKSVPRAENQRCELLLEGGNCARQ